jgi:hypothetical protein
MDRREKGRLLNYFNMKNMDMKYWHGLICLSYPCKWIGERNEVIRIGRGKYELT